MAHPINLSLITVASIARCSVGKKCDFNKQIQEEVLDNAVVEVIIKLVSNPKFAAMMQEKINSKVDTTAIEQEIAAAEKQLRQYYSVKSKLMDEIDTLDPDDRHYIMRKSDLDERLYKMYDKIEGTENQLVTARAKKQAIEADKITGDNIYKVLVCFEKLYNVMNPVERKKLMEHLISEIQIYRSVSPTASGSSPSNSDCLSSKMARICVWTMEVTWRL